MQEVLLGAQTPNHYVTMPGLSLGQKCVCVCASVPYVPYLYNTHEIIHVYTQMCNTITHTYRCIYVIVKYIFVFAMHFMHFYVIYATITWVIKKH